MHNVALKGPDGAGAQTLPAGQSACARVAGAAHARSCVAQEGVGTMVVATGAQLPSEATDFGSVIVTPSAAPHAVETSTGVQAPGVSVTAEQDVPSEHSADVA